MELEVKEDIPMNFPHSDNSESHTVLLSKREVWLSWKFIDGETEHQRKRGFVSEDWHC